MGITTPLISSPFTRTCLLAPALAVCVGCGNHFTPSPHMADAPPAPLAPAADAATLVFMRPSVYAGVFNPSIFVDGKYVGDVEAQRQVVVSVPAGQHVIVSGIHDFMTKACRQMVAKVEAGKIYFVETTVANGADLFAARPSDASKVKAWLGLAPAARKLVDASSPMEAKEQDECMKRAAEHLAEDAAEDKAKHTLDVGDGFGSAP